MSNLFIGVQEKLNPIAPSLLNYLAEQPPFRHCIVRAPLGLQPDEERPLQFEDPLFAAGGCEHLRDGLENVTVFIGSPDLIQIQDWAKIATAISNWSILGCRSICFEAMLQWNAQFQFAYQCCKIAGIEMMVEGVPKAGVVPNDVQILLQSQRFVHRFRIGELSSIYKYNVIVRRDAMKYAGVFKGQFKEVPANLDDLEKKIQTIFNAEVYRYPSS